MMNDSPRSPAAVPDIGSIIDALQRGAIAEAARSLRGLLATDPRNGLAWHLASLASTAGRRPPLAPFLRAIDLVPDRGELWASLAAALENRQERGPAIRAARRALVLSPAIAEAMINFGVTLKEVGNLPAAGAWLDRAGALASGNPVVLNNRALVHLALGQLDLAAVALRHAVTAAPTYTDALLNLAIVERRSSRPSVALAAIIAAIALLPQDSAALAELGTILVTLGDAPSGAAWLGRALASDALNTAAMASHLGALSYLSDLPESRRAAAYARAARQARPTTEIAPRPPVVAKAAGQRLTVGYVSAKWHSHPMTQQLSSLLAHHDRNRVRTIAYVDPGHRDDMTQRLGSLVEEWRETEGRSDRHLADMIRTDGVDVLVFLALHEEGSRRSLPCLRAAPVQVSLHDIATSGLTEIDAWLTDPVLHPAGSTEWFAEPLVRVPSLFLFSALDDGAPSPFARTATSTIGFASFNNPAKLSTATLAAWADILRRTPGATLTLKYQSLFGDPVVAGRVHGIMASHGIAADRLRLETGALARSAHHAAVAAADIVLDPFPYNGNTATIEALWMGTPVVSLAGSRFLGRMGADILERIGHSDLVGTTVDDYVRIATALAGDPPRRQVLRASLRNDVRRSPLFDAAGYARDIEAAYVDLARRMGVLARP
jgi:protein O-GlcNAc transferase